MNQYTVIYMQSEYRITSYRYINCKPGDFEKESEKQGICMSQVWLVFPGHIESISTDWSKL